MCYFVSHHPKHGRAAISRWKCGFRVVWFVVKFEITSRAFMYLCVCVCMYIHMCATHFGNAITALSDTGQIRNGNAVYPLHGHDAPSRRFPVHLRHMYVWVVGKVLLCKLSISRFTSGIQSMCCVRTVCVCVCVSRDVSRCVHGQVSVTGCMHTYMHNKDKMLIKRSTCALLVQCMQRLHVFCMSCAYACINHLKSDL
jgi:hypothetical protein